ncbi:hypothetical protein [Christiangramia aquimixticola]|uniref:hypothetical protein n=1 Tax=Christiangramia aquimixticola TaxID=1697558 RepID=UPI003AA7AE12
MKLQYKIALLGIASAAVAGFVYSQIHIHEKNRREIKEIAEELALAWKEKLKLSYEQTRLLEDTLIEYTIKKNEIINSTLGTEQQIVKLKTIQKSEHKALQKFLNEEQFENYLILSREITRKA